MSKKVSAQSVIITPEKRKAIEVSLGSLFEDKDGRSNKVVTITFIDITSNATLISFEDDVGTKRTYGSLAFVNLYKPFKAETNKD